MNRDRSFLSALGIIWASILAIGLFVVFSPAAPAEAQEENLVQNANFDWGFYTFAGIDSVQPPVEWAPWWNNQADGCFNNQPNMNQAQGSQRVRSGPTAASIWISGGKAFEAGLVQVVDTATPGNIYRFTVYGHAWQAADPSNSGGVSDSDAIVDMKVGIDPTGLNQPFANTVVWSPIKTVLDNYQEFSVEATAQGTQMSVFVYGKPVGCATQTDIYWEDARLFTVGQGEVAPPPAEEAPAEEAPPPENNNNNDGALSPSVGSVNVSEPDETGRQVHTVVANENLTIIALAYDTTITEIRSLNDLSGGLRVGMQLVIREGGGGSAAPVEESDEAAEETTEEASEESSDEEAGEDAEEAESEEVEEPEPVEEVETVTPATICIIHYEDSDADGNRDPDEVLALEGVAFALSDGDSVYERYTTDGMTDSYCFGDVNPGEYIVSWTSSAYTAVSAQSQRAVIGSGETVTREFGAVSAGALPASGEEGAEGGGLLSGLLGGGSDDSEMSDMAEAAPAEDATGEQSGGGIPTIAIAIVGAIGAIFVLSGLGAAAYFLLVRQTAGDEIE